MHRPALLLLLLTAVPALSVASLKLSPESEAQYQQGISILNKTYAEIETVLGQSDTPPPIETVQERLIDIGKRMEPAVAHLIEAAKLHHPAAQYRLALHYQTFLMDQKEEEACQLLESSIESGFAPAALRINARCMTYTGTPRYLKALVDAEEKMSLYADYYPQPTAYFECGKEAPIGVSFQWGHQNDYLADLYKIIGDQSDLRTGLSKRISFYEKAIALNDCPYAKRRIKIFRNRQS